MKKIGKTKTPGCIFLTIWTVIILFLIAGYIQCWIHFIKCDFKEPVKAEIIYGIGCVTGAGAIIGWFDIGK